MRPPRGGGFRGGRDGGFRGGRDGGFRGGRDGGFRGGRGGRGGGFRDEGPPSEVVEISSFLHACEGDAVTKLTNEKIPYFNAPIFLQNKTQIGKVDEIFGPINESFFSIKMMEGIVATSYAPGDKFYIDPSKLFAPLQDFFHNQRDRHKVEEVVLVVVEEEAEVVLVVAEVISVGEAEAEVHLEVVAVDVVALGEEGGDKTTFCNISSLLFL
ncbi:NUCLEOLAR PROTEIN FAMILY A MEMBER 1 SNORNP PROTEIN GAR1 [Salix koriyanagi]|uniref:H/ACA ribonucleoprotein complex subunit n=1 Tax=Salix koriyanagi TaxID=2511006 RepID=A0A9Q0VZ62_9ROSI|nr:NUCLEOLAR PROTEIN FAMILY A MEMBER 1 SNORNP PROTEIN GAR1 [Salix koriyanagi]